MSVPPHLSLVTLGVADLARSTAFYEALGWQRSSASVEGNITFFELGNVVLSVYGSSALADDAVQAVPTAGFRGVTLAITVSSTAEVDRVFAAWVAAGAAPVKDPVSVFWGGYSSYVADPDGHLWEIAWNPHSPHWAAPSD
ncbi:MAG: hypothetical protein FD127_1111 [Acidimicrobiaceae bacterium]|nr:MAG: hypothetical protein FD127_1111 [Acidimicrobiaceae bacterium]